MTWETIENVKPTNPGGPPADGVVITLRKVGRGASRAGYYAIRVGVALAKKVGLGTDIESVRIMSGTGTDVGKIAVVTDAAGTFKARRQKNGCYLLPVSSVAARGLFAPDFAPLTVSRCEAIKPLTGQPPMFVIKLPADRRADPDLVA